MTTSTLLQPNLFSGNDEYRRWLPLVHQLEAAPCEINLWDIPYTIKQLSYLTHSHYRYYGKFPSSVAGKILDEFAPQQPDQYVLDHFCGSGTSLVEAKLRGINSYGVDISWISALVSRVKTRHIDCSLVERLMLDFLTSGISTTKPLKLNLSFAQRWFPNTAINELSLIQSWLFDLPRSPERNFLIVGFLAIVRRVSIAYDGEVRPHVNRDKKPRSVFPAFKKKILDMVQNQAAFQNMTSAKTEADCYVANNLALPARFNDGKCALIISHPPYLNSFNYRPVFSMEFFWGQPFESEVAPKDLFWEELVAHPASEVNTKKYFEHLKSCYREAHEIQPKGGKLAIVIGDCTRSGLLIPVVDTTASIVESTGYRLMQKNYRSTHYGLGKYAYSDRADYHGERVEKKDAILIFQKNQ